MEIISFPSSMDARIIGPARIRYESQTALIFFSMELVRFVFSLKKKEEEKMKSRLKFDESGAPQVTFWNAVNISLFGESQAKVTNSKLLGCVILLHPNVGAANLIFSLHHLHVFEPIRQRTPSYRSLAVNLIPSASNRWREMRLMLPPLCLYRQRRKPGTAHSAEPLTRVDVSSAARFSRVCWPVPHRSPEKK
jgi:hypothetical protein